MTTVTLDMPDKLARRVESLGRWLPTVIEISLLALKTPAVETASEIVEFLASSPSPSEVHTYHASQRAHARMQRLLALNQAGQLSEHETKELDELLKLEHVIVSLKATRSSKYGA